MQAISISMLTICGIEELPTHNKRLVTHVLSILDPGWPDIEAFGDFDTHIRTTLHFDDIIDEIPGKIAPRRGDVEQILGFGMDLAASQSERTEGHLLVHCHMGVSRSTAAMVTLMAQASPDDAEDELFLRLREVRPQAWPNSRMVQFADELLDREGRLVAALRRHYGHQVRANPKYTEWMTKLGRTRELEMATD